MLGQARLEDPQSTPMCESWCCLGPGLRLLGQPDQIPAPCPASWKTGPWSPCSASCGGGSQSRSVYCVLSDGAGVQEATEEAECAGLPGKPPATRPCNLQRCASWSMEPWGEVRPLPSGAVAGIQGGEEVRCWVLVAWGGSRAALGIIFSAGGNRS